MANQTRVAFESHFALTTRQAWQHKDGTYMNPDIQAKWLGYQAGVAAAQAASAEWRDFLVKLSATDGGMVNGNYLSRAAKELLDNSPPRS